MPPEPHPIQNLHIDDFSPGGYDGSHISIESPEISAPLGACSLRNTYCCAVLPGGGLGPLPARTQALPFSTIGGLPGSATLALIAGFILTQNLNTGGNEVVTVIEADDGTNHYVKATSYNDNTTVLTTITGPTATYGTVAGFFGAPYPAFTRMNAGGTAGPPPPGPVLVFPTAVSTDTARGPAGHLWVYPTLSAPTTFVAQDLITGTIAGMNVSSVTGQVITYGNRVICIVGVTYQWPTGGGILTNENFNYCDPPESQTYGNQQTIMAVEVPWGYGAWGTVSVGELLLVKKSGGAVILNGDINTPSSIIRVPGVQSTGDLVGQAAPTPNGLIYCSEKQGAWVWNGGNTSQKISRNISDNFFDLESGVIGSNNYGFNVFHWQKWVMFSNNVMYDTDTGSWWQLYPKKGVNPGPLTGQDIWWYSNASFGNKIAVSPLKVNGNTDPWYSIFDNTVPSSYYQWQSLPINIGTPDRVTDVRQITVRASDPTNTGTATIGVAVGSFSQTSVAATTPIGPNPTSLRFNVGTGAEGIEAIILTIIANNPTGGGSAPIIHSIDVGYRSRARVGVAD
jgi:hypothetical protein